MKTRTHRGKEQGYCATGDHWLDLTEENFYFKGSGSQRHVYLGRCRKHEQKRSAAWHREHPRKKKATTAKKSTAKKTSRKTTKTVARKKTAARKTTNGRTS